MPFIDWDQYCRQKGSEPVAVTHPPRGSLCWQDVVTKTCFYLAPARAAEISRAGGEYLEHLAGEGPEAVYNFLNGNDADSPPLARLFLELPYLPAGARFAGEAKLPLAWRLADHLVIRAGLCYALGGGFPGHNWHEYQAAVLTLGADLYSKAADAPTLELPPDIACALGMAEDCLKGNPDRRLEDIKVDLVKFAAVKIKGYFLETNKLPNIRGASLLLDSLNRSRLPWLIGRTFTPEAVVYAGGGKLLAIVPAGRGEEIARKLEELFEQVTITAGGVAAAITVKAAELLPGRFKEAAFYLERALQRRQQLKIDWRLDPEEGEVNAGLAPDEYPLEDYGRRLTGEAEGLCNHCNLRRGRVQIKQAGENIRLCLPCYHRFRAGGREGKHSFKADFREFCRRQGLYLEEETGINDLAQLAAKGGRHNQYIAMIYADGNNMGHMVMNIDSLPAFRTFSRVTDRAAAETVYAALARIQGNNAVEIIALGGDDILLFVPAPTALAVATAIGEGFDAAFRNLSDGKQGLTLSVGVAIGKFNQPVQYLFTTCQELLKLAKDRARTLAKEGRPGGTLDVVVMESYVNYSTSIATYRRDTAAGNPGGTGLQVATAGEDRLFMRPYTWKEVRAITRAILELQSINGGQAFCFQMRAARMQMTPGEAGLFYLYKTCRLDVGVRRRVERVMTELADALGGRPLAADIVVGKTRYFPWLDLVELWDYCQGWNRREVAGHVTGRAEILAGGDHPAGF